MVLKHMYQLCNPMSKIKIDKTYSDFVMPELKVKPVNVQCLAKRTHLSRQTFSCLVILTSQVHGF